MVIVAGVPNRRNRIVISGYASLFYGLLIAVIDTTSGKLSLDDTTGIGVQLEGRGFGFRRSNQNRLVSPILPKLQQNPKIWGLIIGLVGQSGTSCRRRTRDCGDLQ